MLVGGAYAFGRYTGITRHTKDFDIFIHPRDVGAVMGVFTKARFQTEIPFPHWIGKAYCGEDFVDVIYSSGNAIAAVDDLWFEHAVDDEVFGLPVKLVPPEEIIWSKAFIQERERFDGADVAHVIRACGTSMDWERLLKRFDSYWRILFQHLVVFGFIYPGEQSRVPAWVMRAMIRRLEDEVAHPPADEHLCRGTVLSRQQYLPDITTWGYVDLRTLPENPMTEEHIAIWTAGIAIDGAGH